MPTRRMLRINQLLREEIAELLRREVRDETLSTSLISITEVDTSPDLRNARVYFSVFGTPEEVAAAQQHLEHAAGFLHRELKGRLDLRVVPHLEFHLDHSIEDGARIMRLMRGIEVEREHTGGAAGDTAEHPDSATH